MTGQGFPTQYFLSTLVRLLDTLKYKDTNYVYEERVRKLKETYNEGAKHFAQPHVQSALAAIQVKPKNVEATFRTITRMVVYCWVRASPELMTSLAIYYTYCLLLDDVPNDAHSSMQTFFEDMMAGNHQQHPWWRLVNEQLPDVLKHYGPFCSLNIYRSTVDFFEGCWIEQYQFQGYRGAKDYPEFMRRMNGIGHAVGASIWPREVFDEQQLFTEITTAMCMIENWMPWVNDLISFYKEFDEPHDQISLVNNYCHVEGITLNEGLEKLTNKTLSITEQLVSVFADKDPRVAETLTRFMHGYVTWHLCDKRYRISEIYEQITGDEEMVELSFRRYYEEAKKVYVDPAEWTVPSGTLLPAQIQINGATGTMTISGEEISNQNGSIH